jgi:hypothetical protein
MKGVNWSKSRKVLRAITVCLSIYCLWFLGVLIRLNCIVTTVTTAVKVLSYKRPASGSYRLGALRGGLDHYTPDPY